MQYLYGAICILPDMFNTAVNDNRERSSKRIITYTCKRISRQLNDYQFALYTTYVSAVCPKF